MTPLDGTDARILLALDRNPQATVVALANDLGLARNTVQARLRRMETSGVLSSTSRRVEPEALGYPLMAFVTVTISQRMRDQANAALAGLPEIVELLATTGDGDMLARVVARDTADLNRVTESLLDMPGIVRTSTSIVLKKIHSLRMDLLLERLADR
ncbi:putative transcriptional regulator, AsnC family protein [Kineosporia sp. NBRC 101677]|uniref:Lrp/AsnC family transcriptional regulator n=1 Tax=Kineosporia sp. NBRC 101677 TaxID=3032197 RepID=UPI0024A29AE0|nr:Lrp/AsnC family transcriptional regulator [Kineosporia sp. NBRC 101677]GLY15263.1 putative transcriptional regulator, AsnC family protein [Kineosporia sp. NBRC 101677]